MIDLLAARLIPNHENTEDRGVRHAYGVLCGAMGIALNILLFVFKSLAGVISGSIAITADAFNNLSDAGSQVVSLISFRIAAKPADREHPFGY